MKFLFTCGGTAGHINPAISIAERIRELLPDSQILFVGAKGQMETRRVPEAGFEIKSVTITNLQRSFKPDKILHNLNTVKNLILSGTEAKKIVREFKPDVAIGTGGYVCYPVLNAAHSLKIPCVLHESNAVPGLTTKMLSGKVDKLLVGFKDNNKQYRDASKVIYTGTPVRGDFPNCDCKKAKKELGFSTSKPLILSVWGSLGSSHMNNMMEEFIPLAAKDGKFNLIHAVGEREFKSLLTKLGGSKAIAENIDVREYIHDMHRVMAAADLVLCRAGASTLSELAIMGKPTVLIPSPNVTNNHQEKNARVLEASGAAKVLLEGEFDAQALYTLVSNLLSDDEKLKSMSKAMEKQSVPNAADRITDIVLDLCCAK